ncbi:hypothetical protein II582_00715 [bacterium]|nr:hypothetical protein [bacterium]
MLELKSNPSPRFHRGAPLTGSKISPLSGGVAKQMGLPYKILRLAPQNDTQIIIINSLDELITIKIRHTFCRD